MYRFLDLIKIFHQFCEPLPAKYGDFKTKLHELFPIIFDTKHICFNIRKKMTSHYPNLEVIVIPFTGSPWLHCLGSKFY